MFEDRIRQVDEPGPLPVVAAKRGQDLIGRLLQPGQIEILAGDFLGLVEDADLDNARDGRLNRNAKAAGLRRHGSQFVPFAVARLVGKGCLAGVKARVANIDLDEVAVMRGAAVVHLKQGCSVIDLIRTGRQQLAGRGYRDRVLLHRRQFRTGFGRLGPWIGDVLAARARLQLRGTFGQLRQVEFLAGMIVSLVDGTDFHLAGQGGFRRNDVAIGSETDLLGHVPGQVGGLKRQHGPAGIEVSVADVGADEAAIPGCVQIFHVEHRRSHVDHHGDLVLRGARVGRHHFAALADNAQREPVFTLGVRVQIEARLLGRTFAQLHPFAVGVIQTIDDDLANLVSFARSC